MELFLHELAHLSISLIAGFLVWKKYKRALPAFLAALLGGVLIDLDHLFDYFLVYGFQFDLYKFLKGYHFDISQKIYVPFHAWEYTILLTILYLILQRRFQQKKQAIYKILLTVLLALTLGIYSHLIIDTLTNNLTLPGYSIIYRLIINFDANKII